MSVKVDVAGSKRENKPLSSTVDKARAVSSLHLPSARGLTVPWFAKIVLSRAQEPLGPFAQT